MLALFFNLWLSPSAATLCFKKPCAVGSKQFRVKCFFFHLGLELWIPGQCLLLMLITIRSFPDGTPKKYSPLLLPGKHCRAPSLIQSEKISGEMFRRVSARFPAENVWLLFAFGSGTPLPSEGCWGSSGKWLRSWDPEGEKLQILQGGAGCAGPLV